MTHHSPISALFAGGFAAMIALIETAVSMPEWLERFAGWGAVCFVLWWIMGRYVAEQDAQRENVRKLHEAVESFKRFEAGEAATHEKLDEKQDKLDEKQDRIIELLEATLK